MKKRDAPRVCVVVVNWNGAADTIELVESLLKQTHPNVDTIIVDNGSDSNDVDTLRARFGSRIRLVALNTNRGCGGGYNAGVEAALEDGDPSYVVIMNNDMTAAPDMVAELVTAAESDVYPGIVGAKIFYSEYEGRTDVVWSAGGRFHPLAWRIHSRRGAGAIDSSRFARNEPVEWVSGATMLFRPDVFNAVGPFNERHILGYEDMEFCRKASSAGQGILFAPRAQSWHKVGVSAQRAHISYTNPAAYYDFIRTCFPAYVYAWHLCLLPLLLVKWGIMYLVRDRDTQALKGFARHLVALLTRR